MRKLVMLIFYMWGFSVLAHEGAHGPEQKLAPHGGVLRDSASLMFELVKSGDHIKIYPLSHGGKAIDTQLIEVDSKKTMLTDAKKRTVPHTLITERDVFIVKFEKGKSHRYLFRFYVKHAGKENKADWQIELGSE